MSSPYKKCKTTNQAWVGYLNISKLEPNTAYKMIGLNQTNHLEYGPGQQATIQAQDGKRWRVQLRGKQLANLSNTGIDDIKQDIARGNNPYLVYRETMPDKSYRIDIVEDSESMRSHFTNKQEVDELQDSVDEGNGADGEGKGGGNGLDGAVSGVADGENDERDSGNV